MASSARFNLRLDKREKHLFARAAELMGTTMAGFVRAAAKEKANAIIERETRLWRDGGYWSAYRRITFNTQAVP
jgi:uncharacterized protein (DUF1778 family)